MSKLDYILIIPGIGACNFQLGAHWAQSLGGWGRKDYLSPQTVCSMSMEGGGRGSPFSSTSFNWTTREIWSETAAVFWWVVGVFVGASTSSLPLPPFLSGNQEIIGLYDIMLYVNLVGFSLCS